MLEVSTMFRRQPIKPIPSSEDPDKDLGLGGRLASQNMRAMNQDGSFNVVRTGLSRREMLNVYHMLLTMSWGRFFRLVLLIYFVVNALFAIGYLLCGPGAIAGAEAPALGGRFVNAFFFSVQTIATIGYGKMTPEGIPANILVSLEALIGLLGFALATGLLFSRFSRPVARIKFSANALIAPYHEGRALMFRMANSSTNELTDVRAQVTLMRGEPTGGPARKFFQLRLEREHVMLFPSQWVVVHPLDANSPLAHLSGDTLASCAPELMVLISATDETFSQQVHVRFSYRFEEMVWGAKFRDVYSKTQDGLLSLDIRRLDEYDVVPLP